MKKILSSKKLYSLTSGIILCTLLAGCGNRMNYNTMPEFAQEISTFSTFRTDAKDLLKKSNEAYAELKDFTGIVQILDCKTGDPKDNDLGESRFFFKKNRNER